VAASSIHRRIIERPQHGQFPSDAALGISAMTRLLDIAATGLAPAIWGTTYFVTTEFLPDGYPLTVSALRALPAGLLLLMAARRLPSSGVCWGRAAVLGALNFGVFWPLLFVAAYRLPGGVAATVGALQAVMVIGFAWLLLGAPVRAAALAAAAAGAGGVALLILTPAAAFDPVGLIAALAGAASMAMGTVLSRKWRGEVPLLTFTAWQLVAGGLLLLPAALILEPAPPTLTRENWLGLLWLTLIGAAATYPLWLRGLARIEPSAAATLGFLSPIVAVALGWAALGQTLSPTQIAGAAIVLASVWFGQMAARPAPAPRGGTRPCAAVARQSGSATAKNGAAACPRSATGAGVARATGGSARR
jgi:probable blue pigment (indigoidine) exporter